jgi:exo-1,4-beta-D-glucosaminidase
MQTPAKHALWMMAALAVLASPPAHAQTTYAPTQVNDDAGSVTAIGHWQIQDSAKAQQDGAEISSTGIRSVAEQP